VVVLDIDGCLVDSFDRLPHLLAGDRAKYDELHPTDRSIPAGVVVYSALLKDPHLECVFITSRSESGREYTERQLMLALGVNVRASRLLMRPSDEDSTPDTELKPRLLAEAGFSPGDVLLVVEDSATMNAHWRSLGITCWQTLPNTEPLSVQASK
jgi:hypothetical protein